MKCNICKDDFDPAILSEVFNHQHLGKKAIRHAQEVYPNCSGDFAAGVHSFLKGNGTPSYPETKEFIRGYYSAERDCDNIILIKSIGKKAGNDETNGWFKY